MIDEILNLVQTNNAINDVNEALESCHSNRFVYDTGGLLREEELARNKWAIRHYHENLRGEGLE